MLAEGGETAVLPEVSFLFHRQKSGIWGFRSDRSEQVNGYDTKVFSVAGLEMVTRTRIEHLPENLKKQATSTQALYSPILYIYIYGAILYI